MSFTNGLGLDLERTNKAGRTRGGNLTSDELLHRYKGGHVEHYVRYVTLVT